MYFDVMAALDIEDMNKELGEELFDHDLRIDESSLELSEAGNKVVHEIH